MAVPTTVLGKLKLLLDISDTSSDDLLTYLLEIAGQKILDRCYPYDDTQTDVPARYLNKQVEIALFLYNKRGAEGETMHDEQNVRRMYSGADVPPELMRGVTPFVGRVLAVDEDEDA